MSEILRMAEEMEKDLRAVGALPKKPGKIEASILRDAIASDGRLYEIDNHGSSTRAAIDRLEAKRWLVNQGNYWEITDAGRAALASI